MTAAIATMRVGDHADAQYKSTLRRLEIQLVKYQVALDISTIVPEGPESLMKAIDDATKGKHQVSQELIIDVCDAYDHLMEQVGRQLSNSEMIDE